eukprot:CAMPEP_0198305324 /NCGR_PEP_ID=MMETSP1449-20131203/57849_1 /TAXON_ID=420275 /ORGANISM="Attheya septentrionalis, Strain CCMP2084" /LENGTH=534 /DNA_ID=CAMNT_0044007857 /DNA_START=205 /DNA_END=1809 /DNA_ORIENTATION=+
MAPFILAGKLLVASFVVQSPTNTNDSKSRSFLQDNKAIMGKICSSHSSQYSKSRSRVLLSSSKSKTFSGSETDSSMNSDQGTLAQMCSLLGASPTDLLRLAHSSDGVRGVYINRAVKKNDMLLQMPLSSCLRDDMPPQWLRGDDIAEQEEYQEGNDIQPHSYLASRWATRLAANLMDLKYGDLSSTSDANLSAGRNLWMSCLPDAKKLRASLPVHWPEHIVSSAKCTALELAVDSAYFARADAVADLLSGWKDHIEKKNSEIDEKDTTREDVTQEHYQHVLDVVQTRSCRVELGYGPEWGPPLRLLVPVFDFINHGINGNLAAIDMARDGYANAFFGLEVDDSKSSGATEDVLVVRAWRDIDADEEILIDYGDSARPAWQCLVNYGFVPPYRGEEASEDEEDNENVNIAEVYYHGLRYEVGPSVVPIDMVEATAAALVVDSGGNEDDKTLANSGDSTSLLSPQVALTIADRLSEVAFELLQEPTVDKESDDVAQDTEFLIASDLAALLRWFQHQVLVACAGGLRRYAAKLPESE